MVSPIKVDKLEAELGCRSDRATVKFVTRGLCYGFRLGFNPESVSLKSALQNMSSALLQPSVINNYLLDELKKKEEQPACSLPLLSATSTLVVLVSYPKSINQANDI